MIWLSDRSANQHAIAITVKTVVCFHCVFVRSEGVILPRKRRNQGQQRGFGQMEVGQHLINNAESGPRQKENVCFGGSRRDFDWLA